MSKNYQIEGMRCASCVQKISTALKGMAAGISVTLNPPRVVLSGKDIADLDRLNAAVAKIGPYKLKPVANTAIIPPIQSDEEKSRLKTYYPLFLIITAISFVSLNGAESLHDWMLHFMAGFFIVFGFFKFLDLKGFRDAYATYDVLAQYWNNYGLIYPFLELGLGFAFLFKFELTAALWLSVVLMGFSSLGVLKALSEKRKIRCACLGTALNLPMSTITLIENLGMVLMSVLMLASVI